MSDVVALECGGSTPPSIVMSEMTDEAITAALLQMAQERSATFCPSEAARKLADDWRPLMPQIREVAAKLVAARRLRCTQGGEPCDPQTARGPIRLSEAKHETP